MTDEIPPRRTQARSGFEGKPGFDIACDRFRRAVSKLARDRKDEARLAGARIVAEAAEHLMRLASDGEDANSVNQARRERMKQQMARADVRLAALAERLGQPPPTVTFTERIAKADGPGDEPEQARAERPEPGS